MGIVVNEKMVRKASITFRVVGIFICLLAIGLLMLTGLDGSWIPDVLIESMQIGIILLLFGHFLVVYREFETDKPPEIEQETEPMVSPKREFLLRRSEHLDNLLHWVRTSASIIAAIMAAIITVLIGNDVIPMRSVQAVACLVGGAFILAIMSMLAIATSLRDNSVYSYDTPLQESLIPYVYDSEIYVEQLMGVVLNQARSVQSTRNFLAMGLVNLTILGVFGLNLETIVYLSFEIPEVSAIAYILAIFMTILAGAGTAYTFRIPLRRLVDV